MPESSETDHILSRRLNKILETRLENDPVRENNNLIHLIPAYIYMILGYD